MQASKTTLQQVIEGTKQYTIPLFQRAYSWTRSEWLTLWEDLMELCAPGNDHSHFLGSLVTMRTPPQGTTSSVNQFLLIDGQQRLTTLFILLAALRDSIRESDQDLFHGINQTLLVNYFSKGDQRYKLFPTQVDRHTFCEIILSDENQINASGAGNKDVEKSLIQDCYKFFLRVINNCDVSGDRLRDIICTRLSLVKIDLEGDDDPYLVFESLNAKGKPLTQADLIRNFIFMMIPEEEQQSMHESFWSPMERLLGKNLTEFIRHYLCRRGGDIKKNSVYTELKRSVKGLDADQILRDLSKFSGYYARILAPSREKDIDIIYTD